MKKWLACVLMAVMMIAVTACSMVAEAPENEKPTPGGTKTQEEKTPTGTPGGTVEMTPTPGGTNPEITGTADPDEPEIDWDSMPLTGLMFSEAVSSNDTFAAPDGSYCDWIELENGSSEPVSLGQYWISDSKNEPQKFRLPDVTLAAGERYLLYCNGDGEENRPSFKISSSGEKVYLSDENGFCDRIKVPKDLPKNTSFGRKDGEWLYFDSATPGTANGSGYAERTSVPEANFASGCYTEPLTVTLFGEGTIYYTTDGSRPTTKSKVYKDGISVTDVTTIRTFAVKDGRESDMTAFTYVIDKNHTLPILVVKAPQNTLTGDDGVLTDIKGHDEAEIMMTLIENGEEKFSVPCALKLHGNDSRKGKKQNFTVKFRSKYGAGKLHYKLFDDMEADEFDSLLLKGGSEDWAASMIRDEFMTHLALGSSALAVQNCKPVVMYLGDSFFGIYFIREHFDEHYVATHYDVSADSVDVIECNGNCEAGSIKTYNAMISFCRNNDMSKDENYQALTEMADMDSLFDWFIFRTYMGDRDLANIRVFRSSENDGKFRWMFYDMDWGFFSHKGNEIEGTIEGSDTFLTVMQSALKNKNGRDAFLKRYAYQMNNVLNEESITKEIDRFAALMEGDIEADREQWGRTVSAWKQSMNSLYSYVADGKRDKEILGDLKEYFRLSDSQMKEYFGGKYQ